MNEIRVEGAPVATSLSLLPRREGGRQGSAPLVISSIPPRSTSPPFSPGHPTNSPRPDRRHSLPGHGDNRLAAPPPPYLPTGGGGGGGSHSRRRGAEARSAVAAGSGAGCADGAAIGGGRACGGFGALRVSARGGGGSHVFRQAR